MATINQVNKVSMVQFLLAKPLSIPVYQREYSWEEADVRALLGDIGLRVKDGSEHFFGTIALAEEKGEEMLRVIDGQQRITTTLIIYSVLLELMSGLAEKDGQNHEKEFATLRKLRLSHELNDTELDENIRNLSSRRYDNLEGAFKKNYLLVLDHYKSKGLASLQQHLETLQTRFIVCTVMFEVEKRDEMLVFETLNSRGKPLADIDLIRNLIISLCTEPGAIPSEDGVYARNLRLFNKNIHNKDLLAAKELNATPKAVEGFLKDFFLAYTDYKKTELNIETEHTGHYSTFRNLKAVIDELEVESLHDYQELLTEMHSFLLLFVRMEAEDKNPDNAWLSVLSKKNTHYSLVFGLYKKFAKYDRVEKKWSEPPELEKYFRLMAFYWLKLAAVKGTGQSLRSLWIKVLQYAQKNLSAREIYMILSQENSGSLFEIPTDKEFENALLGSPNQVWLPKALATVLGQIAYEKAGMREAIEIKNTSLEHVMPQEPTTDKWPSVDPNSDDFRQTVNQIGNVAMLNGNKNSSLGNNSFASKKKEYKKSQSPLIVGSALGLPNICDYADFDYETIRDRTKVLSSVMTAYFNKALVS